MHIWSPAFVDSSDDWGGDENEIHRTAVKRSQNKRFDVPGPKGIQAKRIKQCASEEEDGEAGFKSATSEGKPDVDYDGLALNDWVAEEVIGCMIELACAD